MLIAEIRRSGNRLIKYRLNSSDTKHLFLYKVGNLFYSFMMNKGILINVNDKEIKNENIKGTKKLPKYAKYYFLSSLNEWFTTKQNIFALKSYQK
tara:strand:+ start:138 stop:422 length:285 start_codon:yes stop_codon:yes gene_type:complete